jgi:hypothetical protein
MRRGWRALVALGGMLSVMACSTSSTPAGAAAACGGDPLACAAGTTCWPADSVPDLRCLPSDPAGGVGAACDQTVGRATCADGLACDQTGSAGGSCTEYCSATQPCPAGFACRTTHIGSGAAAPSVNLCRPMALVNDSGPAPPVPDGAANYDAAPLSYDAAEAPDEGPARQ